MSLSGTCRIKRCSKYLDFQRFFWVFFFLFHPKGLFAQKHERFCFPKTEHLDGRRSFQRTKTKKDFLYGVGAAVMLECWGGQGGGRLAGLQGQTRSCTETPAPVGGQPREASRPLSPDGDGRENRTFVIRFCTNCYFCNVLRSTIQLNFHTRGLFAVKGSWM